MSDVIRMVGNIKFKCNEQTKELIGMEIIDQLTITNGKNLLIQSIDGIYQNRKQQICDKLTAKFVGSLRFDPNLTIVVYILEHQTQIRAIVYNNENFNIIRSKLLENALVGSGEQMGKFLREYNRLKTPGDSLYIGFDPSNNSSKQPIQFIYIDKTRNITDPGLIDTLFLGSGSTALEELYSAPLVHFSQKSTATISERNSAAEFEYSRHCVPVVKLQSYRGGTGPSILQLIIINDLNDRLDQYKVKAQKLQEQIRAQLNKNADQIKIADIDAQTRHLQQQKIELENISKKFHSELRAIENIPHIQSNIHSEINDLRAQINSYKQQIDYRNAFLLGIQQQRADLNQSLSNATAELNKINETISNDNSIESLNQKLKETTQQLSDAYINQQLCKDLKNQLIKQQQELELLKHVDNDLNSLKKENNEADQLLQQQADKQRKIDQIKQELIEKSKIMAENLLLQQGKQKEVDELNASIKARLNQLKVLQEAIQKKQAELDQLQQEDDSSQQLVLLQQELDRIAELVKQRLIDRKYKEQKVLNLQINEKQLKEQIQVQEQSLKHEQERITELTAKTSDLTNVIQQLDQQNIEIARKLNISQKYLQEQQTEYAQLQEKLRLYNQEQLELIEKVKNVDAEVLSLQRQNKELLENIAQQQNLIAELKYQNKLYADEAAAVGVNQATLKQLTIEKEKLQESIEQLKNTIKYKDIIDKDITDTREQLAKLKEEVERLRILGEIDQQIQNTIATDFSKLYPQLKNINTIYELLAEYDKINKERADKQADSRNELLELARKVSQVELFKESAEFMSPTFIEFFSKRMQSPTDSADFARVVSIGMDIYAKNGKNFNSFKNKAYDEFHKQVQALPKFGAHDSGFKMALMSMFHELDGTATEVKTGQFAKLYTQIMRAKILDQEITGPLDYQSVNTIQAITSLIIVFVVQEYFKAIGRNMVALLERGTEADVKLVTDELNRLRKAEYYLASNINLQIAQFLSMIQSTIEFDDISAISAEIKTGILKTAAKMSHKTKNLQVKHHFVHMQNDQQKTMHDSVLTGLREQLSRVIDKKRGLANDVSHIALLATLFYIRILELTNGLHLRIPQFQWLLPSSQKTASTSKEVAQLKNSATEILKEIGIELDSTNRFRLIAKHIPKLIMLDAATQNEAIEEALNESNKTPRGQFFDQYIKYVAKYVQTDPTLSKETNKAFDDLKTLFAQEKTKLLSQ